MRRFSPLSLSFLLFSLLYVGCTSTSAPGSSIQSQTQPSDETFIRVGATDPLVDYKLTEIEKEQLAKIATEEDCALRSDPGLYFGGLAPNTPIGFCFKSGGELPTQALRGQSDIPTILVDNTSWTRLFLFKASEIKRIDTFAELQAEYAPVETPQEALSFVLLRHNYTELLTQERLQNAISEANQRLMGPTSLFTDVVGGTKISQNTDGSFSVQNVLLGADCSANSSAPASAVDYRVLSTGVIEEVKRTELFLTACPLA